MSWPLVKIADIAKINPKHILPKSISPETVVSFVPMAAVSEVNYQVENEEERLLEQVNKGFTNFQNGDVLVAKITPCFENGKLAIANINHSLGFGSTEFHVLRSQAELHARYLYHFLRQDKIRFLGERQMRGSAGQKRIPKTFFADLQIPLPPLVEQQRIAAILDKADSLRAKRRAALAKLDTLLQNVFLDMFGDPVTNPKGWEVVKLGDVSQEIRYGTSVMCHNQKRNNDLPVLRIPNIIGCEVDWKNLKYASFSKKEKNKLVMCQDDLLFVRSNGNPDYIGRSTVFKGTQKAVFASYLIRARLIVDSRVCADFIQQCISSQNFRHLLVSKARTTAGNYNISASHLKKLPIIAPPQSKQMQFLVIKEEILRAKRNMLVKIACLDTLFHALQQRAFKGEL